MSCISCMLLNCVAVTSRCHPTLKHKNRLVSLTSCQCIFMWHRMIHPKGEVCIMLLVADVFFLTLALIWNRHKCIQLLPDCSSARSTHIIPVGKRSLFCTWWGLHFGTESEGLELESNPHPRLILFMHRKNVEIPSCCMKWSGYRWFLHRQHRTMFARRMRSWHLLTPVNFV